ncbi:MAG: GNAT family N-acetyltransferase [Pseudomonadota bacterium]
MTADLDIRPSNVTEPPVIALLTAHFENMRAISPPDACFVLDLDGLRAPDVQMLAAWRGKDLAAIGALKHHGDGLFEIKSMRSDDRFRRNGAGSAILAALIDLAKTQGAAHLALETGTTDHFAPSRGLYARFGFAPCGPFADYAAHPHSLFMDRPARM